MAIAAFKCLKCTGAVTGGVHAAQTDSLKHPCFLNSDLHSTNTGDYPLKAPAVSGTYVYSYEMWLRWELTAAPDTYIQNFAVYNTNPGAIGEGIYVSWASVSGAVAPTVASSVIATGLITNNISAGTALPVIISGEPYQRLTAVGHKTQYLVAQMKINSDVEQGGIPTQLWSITYEET